MISKSLRRRISALNRAGLKRIPHQVTDEAEEAGDVAANSVESPAKRPEQQPGLEDSLGGVETENAMGRF